MIPKIYRPLLKCCLAAVFLAGLIGLSGWISQNLWEPAGIIHAICWGIFLLVLPAIFILIGRNTLEEMQYEEMRGFIPTFLRVLLGGPLGCVGVCTILIGIAIPIWVIWSLFDPQAEFRGSPWGAVLQIVFFVMMIPLGWYFIRLGLGRKVGPTVSEESAARERFLEELRNPDFASFETEVGHPFPDSLRRLYEGTSSFAMNALDESVVFPFSEFDDGFIQIAAFLPVTSQNCCDETGEPGADWYCFAVTEMNDKLIFQPKSETKPIWLVQADERIYVAETVDDFCRKLDVV